MILDFNDIENNDEDFEIEKEDIKFKARRKTKLCIRAPVIKYHHLSGLNNRNL